ncbi:MAG: hypothetical protein ABJA67_09240 [Chthonomonadales bacterium]
MGEALDIMAQTLGYKWAENSRGGKGYEMSQDLASRNREQKIYDQSHRKVMDLLQQEVNVLLAYAKLTVSDLQSLKDKAEASLNDSTKTAEQKVELKREVSRIEMVLADGPKTATLHLISSLSNLQFQQLLDKKILKFSAKSSRGMYPLASEIANGILETGDDDSDRWYRNYKPTDVRAELRLSQTAQRVVLQARTQRMGSAPPDQVSQATIILRITCKLPTDSSPTADEDAERAALLKQDNDKLNKKINIKLNPKVPSWNNPSTYVGHRTFTDILLAASIEEEELSYIADASLDETPFHTEADDTVGKVLVRLGVEGEHRIKYDSRGYVLARSKHVYNIRQNAIPATVLRQMFERATRRDGLTLAYYAWFASNNTDNQLDALVDAVGRNMFFRWPRMTVQCFLESKNDLRLVATLSNSQINKLRRGQRLEISELSAISLDALVFALETYDASHESNQIQTFSLDLAKGLGLALNSRNMEDLAHLQGHLQFRYGMNDNSEEDVISNCYIVIPEAHIVRPEMKGQSPVVLLEKVEE